MILQLAPSSTARDAAFLTKVLWTAMLTIAWWWVFKPRTTPSSDFMKRLRFAIAFVALLFWLAGVTW